MSDFHQLLSDASAWLWPAMANHLWQSTLFAALAYGATLLLRDGPARVRYALWLAAAAKFALPSALFVPLAARLGVGSQSASAEAGGAAPLVLLIAEPLGAAAPDLAAGVSGAPAHGELYCALTVLWLAGVAALLAVWLKRRREFLRSVSAGREVWSGREFEAVGRARARLGLGRDVRLLLSEGRTEPGVWRTRRPVLVLPSEVSAQLDDEELETVVLHELAHVERRDNLFANLQTALACVFWFNPAVWLVGRGLFAEREAACDERVLEAGGAAETYAAGILKVVRFCTGWRVAGVSGVGSGSNLRRRIEMIMREEKGGRFSAWHRALACGFAAAAFALTVGAGLYSGANRVEARMLEGGEGTQAPARGVVRGGVARGVERRGEEQSPGVAEIEQAAESMVYFEQTAGAPVQITEARMRMITREQLRRADDEGAGASGDDESPFFVTLPTITLANVSGKAVRNVGVGYVKGGRVDVVAGYAASLNPGESHTVRSEWHRRNVILPGTTADVSLRVVWVAFADGTQWGARPGVPPPPPLPKPPAPPLPAGEDEPGEGVGSSTAVGRASGRGAGGAGVRVGVGAGSGRGEGRATGVGAGAAGSLPAAPAPTRRLNIFRERGRV